MSESYSQALVTADGVEAEGAAASGAYQIGSITKVFTALLLAHEVVGGRLALGQPVGDLLPDLRGSSAGEVTLEQLVTHTSGLPRLPPGMWRKAVGAAARNPYADIDEQSLLAALAGLTPRVSARPAYSNLGFGLLGHALSRHLAVSYDEAVRTVVTAPLGMADTGCVPDPQRVVPGLNRRRRPHPMAWEFDAMAGAGALWSTVDDMTVFLRAQLDPPVGPLGDALRLSHEPLVVGRRVSQAMAWMQVRSKDGSLLFHNGGTAGYRSFAAVDHGRGRAAVVLGNTDRSVDRRGFTLVR